MKRNSVLDFLKYNTSSGSTSEGITIPRKLSLGQGNVFTPVCHSVHGGGGGVSAPLHAGIHTPLGSLPTQADILPH